MPRATFRRCFAALRLLRTTSWHGVCVPRGTRRRVCTRRSAASGVSGFEGLRSFSQRVVGPDGEFVAVGVGEVESAAAGEAEGFFGDASAGGLDGLFEGFEIDGVDDDEWSAGRDGVGEGEAAVESSVFEGGIFGAEVFELPSEDLGVEGLGAGDVGGGELDVVDAAVVLGLGHGG